MTKLSNANVTGISEPKLEDKILNSETERNNHDLVRCIRNKNRGGDSSNLSYIKKKFFPKGVGNIFCTILLLSCKSVTVRIVYWLPNQSSFLKSNLFTQLNSFNNETKIIRDFNINLQKYCEISVRIDRVRWSPCFIHKVTTGLSKTLK